jgi:hypothetical protein
MSFSSSTSEISIVSTRSNAAANRSVAKVATPASQLLAMRIGALDGLRMNQATSGPISKLALETLR